MNKYIAIVVFAFLLFGVSIVWRASSSQPTSQMTQDQQQVARVVGRIGDGFFNFEVADSPAERTMGLSGRDPLPDSDAMLFVFDEPSVSHCIWMKDMKFNLDILWFDDKKQLIFEKRNVSPDTYPDEVFCPPAQALYVVEITAGVAEKNQIELGDTLQVEL